jgi:hypothetical protein
VLTATAENVEPVIANPPAALAAARRCGTADNHVVTWLPDMSG